MLAGGRLVSLGYTQGTVIPPRQPLRELPLALGTWRGADVEADEKVLHAVGADQIVTRSFTSSTGGQIALHAALWLDPDQWTPHLPKICYLGAGWKIVEEKTVLLEREGEPDVPVRLMTLEQQGQRIQTLHWYQRGENVYTDRNGARAARRRLWGESQWPPLIKVLLQTSAYDKKQSESRLRELAAFLLDWTQFHH
jgi:EpsI family protein